MPSSAPVCPSISAKAFACLVPAPFSCSSFRIPIRLRRPLYLVLLKKKKNRNAKPRRDSPGPLCHPIPSLAALLPHTGPATVLATLVHYYSYSSSQLALHHAGSSLVDRPAANRCKSLPTCCNIDLHLSPPHYRPTLLAYTADLIHGPGNNVFWKEARGSRREEE